MATKRIAWNSGGGYMTLTYTGSGNGSVSVESDVNNGAARSQVVTIETTAGSTVVTKNLTVNQAACPFPVGQANNYSYTGSVQSVLLPAGKYKLQCWGAQGGSNGTNSTYGITAKAGGNGGYSEGVLTLSEPTTVYIFVGGQGSSSGNGGWNGGGGGNGTSSYDSDDIFGYSKIGCGGGATDIALVTSGMSYSGYRNNRSSASLLSRMIVAGGGSGGMFQYKRTTSYTNYTDSCSDGSFTDGGGSWTGSSVHWMSQVLDITAYRGMQYSITLESLPGGTFYGTPGFMFTKNYGPEGATIQKVSSTACSSTGTYTGTVPSDATYMVLTKTSGNYAYACQWSSVTFTESTESTSTNSKVGYAGGGTNGVGSDANYYGKQNGAGMNGSFGFGANQQTTSYRYHSGMGGGGWYGGGDEYSNASMHSSSGGGSGFVNTYANRSYRPSGYTGLQLDSGTTYAGDTTFESVNGGTETGHSGNGYARITRLE